MSASKIFIDGVIFQIQKNRPAGISRVWSSLLEQLAQTPLAKDIIILDRADTLPKINNFQKVSISEYEQHSFESDSLYLEHIMEKHGGGIFISTYYTYPENSPCITLLHDMTPEALSLNLNHPEWRAKQKAISKSSAFFSVSESTKQDFYKYYPQYLSKPVTVISNAVSEKFVLPTDEEKRLFNRIFSITKPYFIYCGHRLGYKNAISFIKAFNLIPNKENYELFFTGGDPEFEVIFKDQLKGIKYQLQFLSDTELSIAYSGAIALVYSTLYEGFGLPILEAMRSGCPVISGTNSSIPEVAGNSALLVDTTDIMALKECLVKIQDPVLRKDLISKGFQNVKRFSWQKTGEIFAGALDFYKNSKLKINETENINSWERYIRTFYKKPGQNELLKAFSDSIRIFKTLESSFDFKELIQAEKRIVESITDEEFSNLLSAYHLSDNDIMLSYWCGLVYEFRQNYEEAIKAYEKVLKLKLPNVRITYLAANVAYRLNKKQTAEKLYTILLSVNKNFHEGISRLNELHSYTSKTKEEMHLEQFDMSSYKVPDQSYKFEARKSPLVSVVIPTRDRNDGLEDTLASLPAAMNSIDYEVIIYTGKKNHPDLIGLLTKYNITKIFYDEDLFGDQKFNWSKLINDAFAKAEGEWVVYASDDIEFLPNSFSNAFTTTVTDDKTGGITFLHKNTIETYSGVFDNYGYDQLDQYVYINFGVIRKSAFEKINGFDEQFSFYWADVDLCLRIWEAGFKILISPYSLVNHNNITDRLKKENSGDKYFQDTYYFQNKWKKRKLLPETKILSKRRKFLGQGDETKLLKITKESLKNDNNKFEEFISKKDNNPDDTLKEIKVSAIVSTYNSETFLRGCLDDLVNQTLHIKGDMEIIVIISGSKQNEEEIVKEYQKKFINIKYLSTERETIYKAWNRGIKIAAGKFITNANTDDRHRSDALELMAAELENDEQIGLVYSDQYVTYKPNETFEKHTSAGVLEWPEFDRIQLLHCSICGPQPMWRKDLHQKFGYFNENLIVAGDYEWWLRISEDTKLVHIPQILGLYLLSDDSIEHRYTNEMLTETRSVRSYYAEKMNIDSLNYKVYKSTFLRPFANTLFSVIITTYNRPSQLRAAVQSVLEQSLKNIELIVINDGGKDVRGILNQFKDNRIKYYSHSKNKGPAAARNTGISHSTGDYIAFLDDDDIFNPDHLETAHKYLLKGNRIVYTDAIRNTYKKVGSEYLIVNKTIPYSIDYDRNKLLLANISPVNSFVFERKLLNESGTLDENYAVLEDWEFWLRLSKFSEFYHIKKVTVQVNWKDDGSTITSSKQKDFQFFRDEIYKTYSEEIKKITNREQLLAEFNQIWINDSSIRPLVSIIVPTYNQLEYTIEFIESLYKSTQIPFELIVIVNNKSDGTLEYLKSLAVNWDNIHTIVNEENQGFPKSINQGLKAAIGEYLLVINNDVVLTEFCIEKMLNTINVNSNAGIVGPISNIVSGLQRDEKAVYKSIEEMHKYAKSVYHGNKSLYVEFPRVAFLCTLIKKEVIENIGGLDERFSPGNFEDDDFCLRAQLAGYKAVIAKDVFIHHYGSKSFKAEGNNKYDQLIERNRKKFVEKWGADPDEIWIKGKTIKQRNIKYPINSDAYIQSIERALIHVEEDEYYLASEELTKAISAYNPTVTKNYKIEYSEVLSLAEKITQIIGCKSNVNIEEMLNSAEEYINSGKLEQARIVVNSILEIDQANTLALNNMALINILNKEYQLAMDFLEQVLNMDPNNEIALNNLQYLNENL